MEALGWIILMVVGAFIIGFGYHFFHALLAWIFNTRTTYVRGLHVVDEADPEEIPKMFRYLSKTSKKIISKLKTKKDSGYLNKLFDKKINIVEKIEILQVLYDKGLITQEEFTGLKNDLIKSKLMQL